MRKYLKITGKISLSFLLIGLAGLSLQAQTPDALIALSEKSEVSVGEALGQIVQLFGSQPLAPDNAKAYLLTRGVVDADLKLDASLNRGCLASIIMKSKGWGGGLMYSIFGGDRYAWRELVYRRIMPVNGSEYSKVSGGELLAVLGRVAGEVDLKLE